MRVFMSPKLAVVAAAAIVALGCAAPAAAAVVIYTYTGTIYSGFDQTGLFGAGTDLTGLAFTAVFQRDDATPGAFQSQTGVGSRLQGSYGASPVQAILTIGGGTPVTFGDGFGEQVQGDNGSIESFRHSARDDSASLISQIMVEAFGSSAGDYLPNGDFHTLPSLTAAATPEYIWNGSVRIERHLRDPNTGVVLSHYAYASFTPTALTVTVPEPATWALMLTGFFGAGAAIRSRRRAVAYAGQPAH